MKKISIIIPCYNVEKYIDRCLQSVTDQTYPLSDMEILCVNDASTDGTLAKLQSWEARFPDNLMIIDCEENGHLGKARNIGLSYATGEWIAFIDSDDWIERDYLSSLYETAVQGDYQLVACREERDSSEGLTYFSDSSSRTDASDPTDYSESQAVGNHRKNEDSVIPYTIDSPTSRRNFFMTQPLKLYAWGRIIRRDFLIDNELFFPEHLAYEDIVWGNLVNMYLERAALIDRAMYHYYVNPDSIVLKRNESYHIDHISTQEIMWEQLIGRGFGNEYLPEIQYEYLYDGYLGMLKILALRFDEPSYSYFRLLQELTRSKVPADACARFVSDPGIPELHRLLFGMIHQYVSRDGFSQMMEILRKGGL